MVINNPSYNGIFIKYFLFYFQYFQETNNLYNLFTCTFLYPIILPDKVSKMSAQILRKICDFHIISRRNFSKSQDKRRRKTLQF